MSKFTTPTDSTSGLSLIKKEIGFCQSETEVPGGLVN